MKQSNHLIWFSLFFICLMISVVSCDFTEPEAPIENIESPIIDSTSAVVDYYVWVNNLNVRNGPNKDSEVIFRLEEGAKVIYNHVKSDTIIHVNLRSKQYTGPYFLIKTKSGKEGWVFSGALTKINPESEKEFEFNGDSLLIWENGISSMMINQEISQKNISDFANLYDLRIISSLDSTSTDPADSQILRFYDKRDLTNSFYIQYEDRNMRIIRDIFFDTDFISDQYNIRVGDTFEKIKNQRSKVFQTSTSRGNTYVIEAGSNIMYEICCAPEDSDKAQYSDNDVKNWKVVKIIWRQYLKKG